MKRTRQQMIARVIALPAALVTTACTGLLVWSYIDSCYRAPVDTKRVEAMEVAAKQDAALLPVLREEQDRQTDVSLARTARMKQASNTLIVAAILLIIGVKWSQVLADRRVIELATMTKPRTLRSNGMSTRPANEAGACTPDACHGCDTKAPPVDLTFVEEAVGVHGRSPEALIPILHAVQSHYRYLPQTALDRLCTITEIAPARITGVSSFFKQFRHSPVGEHVVKVCHGTACHVAGAQTITDEIRRYLGLDPDEDTDAQRRFTVESVACLGCCTLAPVAQIDQSTYGHLATDTVSEMLDDCLERPTNGRGRSRTAVAAAGRSAEAPVGEIRIGLGSCCVAGGSGDVYAALENAVAASGAHVTIKRVGCVGMCHQIPLVEAVIGGQPTALYAGVVPEDAAAIVGRHFRANRLSKRITSTASRVVDRFLNDGAARRIVRRSIEVRDPPVAAFLGRQKQIATEHGGQIDPTDLDEYLRHDGFAALERCAKELSPREIIEEVERSGLRGRGGAGFPTGVKWSKVRAAIGDDKYVICNGDEGDPGAFMDRMLMESFPYRIIEGMAIAARAIGAREGYFYVRAEYPLAVQRLRDALDQCERCGYLGDDILGSGQRLQLSIMEGAGAFVCGEETALLASIEGKRGSPTLRPPYPADSGLHGKPTLVNNVETYATVPWIFRNGAEKFAELGTATSKGTKVFSLAGKVKRGGLIEVPMGVTIREIVEEIGGGVKGNRRFKAVQIGGPSGGCIPAELADTPVDYEALTDIGAIMGSGGLVVLDDSDCMVDIARYFLAFTQDQSCGKCTYCRIGTRRMLDILERLCAGRGHKSDLTTLEELARSVGAGSLCGLGKTAPNPVLSTLRYFRSEYEAHLDGVCPAGKCKELITYRVTDGCIGCTLCAQHCPVDAIPFVPYERHEIDADKCTRCDMCRIKCPEDAIEVT